MTGKIPVGATIARAYGFAFGNIVNNLGMIWIPVAILYGLLFYFHSAYMNAMTVFLSRDFGQMQRVLPYFFAGYAAGCFLIAILVLMMGLSLGKIRRATCRASV